VKNGRLRIGLLGADDGFTGQPFIFNGYEQNS
jgi:hypothetical protein